MAQDMSKVYVNLTNAPTVNTDFGGGTLWQETGLIESTIMRSFAMDYKANPAAPSSVYVVQARDGDVERGAKLGEMRVNKMTNSGVNTGAAGQILNHYHSGNGGLIYDECPDDYFQYYYSEAISYGFGKGEQIAIEYAPDGTYIWLDWNSPAIDRANSPDDGEWDVTGMGLCRVKFVEGSVYSAANPAIQHLTLSKLSLQDAFLQNQGIWRMGIGYVSLSIDNVNKRMAVVYSPVDKLSYDELTVSLYSFDYNNYVSGNVNSINYTLIKSISIPKVPWWLAREDGKCSSSQDNLPLHGVALFGNFLYFAHGTAYWAATGSTYGQDKFFAPSTASGNYFDGTPVTKVGNAHLTRHDWTTNTQSEQIHSEAGKSDNHREIEGLQMIPTVDGTGTITSLALQLGLSGGVVGSRHWSIFNKTNTIPQP
jgi:hypothetical protein